MLGAFQAHYGTSCGGRGKGAGRRSNRGGYVAAAVGEGTMTVPMLASIVLEVTTAAIAVLFRASL